MEMNRIDTLSNSKFMTGMKLSSLTLAMTLAGCGGGTAIVDETISSVTDNNGSNTNTNTDNSNNDNSTDTNTDSDGEVVNYTIPPLSVNPNKIEYDEEVVPFTVTVKAQDSAGGGVSGQEIQLSVVDAVKYGVSISGSSKQTTTTNGSAVFNVEFDPQNAEEIPSTLAFTAKATNGNGATSSKSVSVAKVGDTSPTDKESDITISAKNSTNLANKFGDNVTVSVKAVNKDSVAVSGEQVTIGIDSSLQGVSIIGGANKTTNANGEVDFQIAIEEGYEDSLKDKTVQYSVLLTESNGATKQLGGSFKIADPVSEFTLDVNSPVDALNPLGDSQVLTVKASTDGDTNPAGSTAKFILSDELKALGVKASPETSTLNANGETSITVTIPSGLTQEQRNTLEKGLQYTLTLEEPNKSETVIDSNSKAIDILTPDAMYSANNITVDIVDDKFLKAGDTSQVIVTLKNDNNEPVSGEKISLIELPEGMVIDSAFSTTTNANGKASFDITLPSDNSVEKGSKTLKVQLTESTGVTTDKVASFDVQSEFLSEKQLVNKTSKTVNPYGDNFAVTLQAKDKTNTPLANQSVRFELLEEIDGVTLVSDAEQLTGADGMVTFTIRVSDIEDIENLVNKDIAAKAVLSEPDGSTAVVDFTLDVAKPANQFNVTASNTTSSTNELNAYGDETEITIEATPKNADSLSAAGSVVTIELVGDYPEQVSLSQQKVTLDGSGKATVTLSIADGIVDKTAIANNNIKYKVSIVEPNGGTNDSAGTRTVFVENPQTDNIVTLAAVSNDKQISPNGGSAEVFIRVSDKTGGAVAGEKVTLELVDTDLVRQGLFFIDNGSTQTTDENGLAKFKVSVPSDRTTELTNLGKIELKATYKDSTNQAEETLPKFAITVSSDADQSNYDIELSKTKNSIIVEGDTFSVVAQVTDSVGNGVEAQKVKINIPALPGLSLTSGSAVQTTDAAGKAQFDFEIADNLTSEQQTALDASEIKLTAILTDENDLQKTSEEITVNAIQAQQSGDSSFIQLTNRDLSVDGDTLELKFQALDTNDNFIANQEVKLDLTGVSNANLITIDNQIGSALAISSTDDKGIVSFTLQVPQDLTQSQKDALLSGLNGGTIFFVESSGDKVQQPVNISFTEAPSGLLNISETVSSSSMNVLGDSVTVNVLVDNSVSGVADQRVYFDLNIDAAKNGVTLDRKEATTNASGIASFVITIPDNLTSSQRLTLLAGNNIGFGYSTVDSQNTVVTGSGTIEVKQEDSTVTDSTMNFGQSKVINSNGDQFQLFVQVKDTLGKGISDEEVQLRILEPLKTGVSFANNQSTAITDANGIATFDLIQTPSNAVDLALLEQGIKVQATTNIDEPKTEDYTIAVSKDEVITNYIITSTTDSSNLLTGGDTTNVTLRVINENGGVLSGVPIQLKVNDAANTGLALTTASKLITDENGVINTGVALSSNSAASRLNQEVTLEAFVSDEFKNDGITPKFIESVQLFKTGTTVNLEADKLNLNENDSVIFTVTATDGKRNRISGGLVTLTNISGDTIPSIFVDENGIEKPGQDKLTNSDGQIRLKVNEVDIRGLFDDDSNLEVATLISDKGISQSGDNTLTVTAVDRSGIGFVGIDETKLYPVKETNGACPDDTSAEDYPCIELPVQVRVGLNESLNSLVGKTIQLETTLGLLGSDDVLDAYTITQDDVNNVLNDNSLPDNIFTKNFILNPTTVGSATITTTIDDKSATASLKVVATDPSKLLLQSTKSVLSPGESTEIIAIVKNDDDVPVQGQRVVFTKVLDSSAGSLSKSVATTDAEGKASVKFTAGSTTPDSAIEIEAKLPDHPTIQAQPNSVNFTVSDDAAYITLGFSNKIATSSDNVYYEKQGSIIVVDGSGKPKANQEVSVKLFAHSYRMGSFLPAFDSSGDAVWAGTGRTGFINSEDVNRNFTLDPGEDGNTNRQAYTQAITQINNTTTGNLQINSIEAINQAYGVNASSAGSCVDFVATGETCYVDGVLQAKNPVAIQGGNSSNGVYTFTTDDNGKFDFTLVYPKEYAEWLRLEIVSETNVFGSEFSNKDFYTLEVGEVDISEGEDLDRPNVVSPYNHKTN